MVMARSSVMQRADRRIAYFREVLHGELVPDALLNSQKIKLAQVVTGRA
jgi:hypothetical protein